jgi:hypothetical protein
MANQVNGETPVDGACIYCGASLVQRWSEYVPLGETKPRRLTEAQLFCVQGHPQPLPGEPSNDD